MRVYGVELGVQGLGCRVVGSLSGFYDQGLSRGLFQDLYSYKVFMGFHVYTTKFGVESLILEGLYGSLRFLSVRVIRFHGVLRFFGRGSC